MICKMIMKNDLIQVKSILVELGLKQPISSLHKQWLNSKLTPSTEMFREFNERQIRIGGLS